ncbi:MULTISPECIES: cardiolipin synthase [unclassified Fusibacter]|uniref:cardiolipin synthase n=1 Tax=unclassified Fusibacter TaxID=2624464 RepID=UPI001012292E|nr:MULTISPECIES: cardiolipin synthase [unclassified Fusibacter]MCK8059470.1 cardiolipin synthase [Fusibacter sp. A2]NPE21066.1 cardiolipin synthase [Fusibacter sp. A1]RXV62340.1 cardiolipin synthase [Fusibacter sp. A1]
MGRLLKRAINFAIILMLSILSFLVVSVLQKWHIFNFLHWSDLAVVIKAFFSFYVLGIGIFIFLDNRNPYKIISWLIVLIAFPVVGFASYLIFGRSFRKRRLSQSKLEFTKDYMARRADVQSGLVHIVDHFNDSLVNSRLVNLLLNNSKAPFFLENEIDIYSDGASFFSQLIKDISSAKHHIHLEYFIIRNDEIGNMIREALIERSLAGVEVRLIYDSVGCWKLGNKYINSLKAAGVQCYEFLPLILPLFGREMNYRNHRKITVIDGKYGYVGGMNLGDEYIGKHKYLGFWRDTHLRIHGEAVNGLQHCFLMDWTFVSRQLLMYEDYSVKTTVTNHSLVQIAASGPDADWEVMLQAYFTMIATAESRIWITTPYLVPEESIMEGLITAALSGLDVRILIPSTPDHFLVYWAGKANIEKLLKSGVAIYLYEKGFVHSKTMIIDESVATVGTANLDIRSLEINFEINAFLYDKEQILRLSEDFLDDITMSHMLTLEEHAKRPWWHRLLEAVGRIASPLQ